MARRTACSANMLSMFLFDRRTALPSPLIPWAMVMLPSAESKAPSTDSATSRTPSATTVNPERTVPVMLTTSGELDIAGGHGDVTLYNVRLL